MKVGFRDARVQGLFNDHAGLEARYGSEIAAKVATRMALLVAANNLAVLPRQSPVGFQAVSNAPGHFTMDLGDNHRLRFVACDGGKPPQKPGELHHVEEIEVIGVE